MKELKEEILQAVNDATDLTDNIVSMPILSHFLDNILSEQLNLHVVGCQREQLITFLMKVGDCYGMELRENAERCVDEILSN